MRALIIKLLSFFGIEVVFASGKDAFDNVELTHNAGYGNRPDSHKPSTVIPVATHNKLPEPLVCPVVANWDITINKPVPEVEPEPSVISTPPLSVDWIIKESVVVEAPALPSFTPANLVKRAIFSDVNPDLRIRYANYLKKNLHVLEMFTEFARAAKNNGFDRYSAKAIMERVRWESDVYGDETDPFKVNNSYTSLMARTLVTLLPEEFEGFFELRHSSKAG